MHFFVDTVGCKKTTPHLLLLDGHASRKTLDFILYSREWRRHTNFPASLHPSTTTPGSNVLPILEGSVFTCGRQLDDLETSTDRSRSLTSSRSSMRRTKRRPPSHRQLTGSGRLDYGHLMTPNSTKNYWQPPLFNLPLSLLSVLASMVCMSRLISTEKLRCKS